MKKLAASKSAEPCKEEAITDLGGQSVPTFDMSSDDAEDHEHVYFPEVEGEFGKDEVVKGEVFKRKAGKGEAFEALV